MSFFKRMLSSVGIGSAKVDTVLERDKYSPGELMEGVVKIKGGSTEQQIDGLYFSVQCTYEAVVKMPDFEFDEEDEGFFIDDEEASEQEVTKTAVLEKFKLKDSMAIGPGDEEEIPISFTLPWKTPLTMGKTKVWLRTGLDIQKGLDAGDRDYIEVVPDGRVAALFDALGELGFELTEAECEAVPSKWRGVPFAQEFEFKAGRGEFRGQINELEIVCYPGEFDVEVHMEIDRKTRGIASFFSEMMGKGEEKTRFIFKDDDLPDLTGKVCEAIEARF